MKHLLVIFILLSTSHFSFCQKDWKKEISVFAMPNIGYRILTTEGIPKGYSASEANYKDSLNGADFQKIALSAGMGIAFYKDDYSRFEVGFRYSDQGFTRAKKNLGFGDLIHPEVGVVKDNSQTGSDKDVHFVYRFQYLQIPLFYHFTPYKVKKVQEIDFFFTAGISANILLEHTVNAKLQGWTAYGKEKFRIDKHEYNPATANFNVHLGFRMHYNIDNKTAVLIAPSASMGVLNANDGSEKYRLLDLSFPIGIIYKIGKDN